MFKLQTPKKYTLPRDKWEDKNLYDSELLNLFGLFEKNYSKYSI